MNVSSLFNASCNASITDASPRGIYLVVVESCICVVLNITALVGNLLVCVAIYKNITLRTITNIFILSLAFTDLLMAVFIMFLVTASSFADRWVAGELGIDVYGYCGHVASGTSLITVMLLAIKRYFRVVKPLLCREIYSKKSSTFMAVAALTATAFVTGAVYPLLGIRLAISHINPTVLLTTLSSRNTFFYFNLMRMNYLFFPSLAVIICYLKIYQTIRQHNTTAAPSSQEGHSILYGVMNQTFRLEFLIIIRYLF